MLSITTVFTMNFYETDVNNVANMFYESDKKFGCLMILAKLVVEACLIAIIGLLKSSLLMLKTQ